ncbi:hypothetical protein FRC10_001411 [Ceratobasidium sp. 414]|nr:hypothetical protein FRC10_001411 [Ceratobasidium sp. 414]
MANRALLEQIRQIIPPLTPKLHKGQAGRVGVIGGSEDYTGAPYFAAISALRLDMYVVIDADGLYLVQNEPDVVKGNARAVLTPNVVEFKRLCDSLKIDTKGEPSSFAPALSKALGGVTIIQKGQTDLIVSGDQVEEINEPGGLKRCGGQGDILSGMAGTFLAWGKSYVEGGLDGGDAQGERIPEQRVPLLAAAGASILTRATSHIAFGKLGRGVITGDMITEIGAAYAAKFGEQGEKGWKGMA